jgi:hypothetical protein
VFDVTTYEVYQLAYSRYLAQLTEQPRRALWTDEQWDRHELLRLCNELQGRLRGLEAEIRILKRPLEPTLAPLDAAVA